MFQSKNTQIFIACIGLVFTGAIFEPLISQPFFRIISLLSGIGGIVGGACALIALFQWRKQIKYGKKLEVLEVLEKVHSTGSSLDMYLQAMFLDAVLFAKIEEECVKSQHEERYKLFYKKYQEGVDKIKLLHAELQGPSIL
ncbi:hypothetical protein JL49_25290, partial [Pseudoalteromonas luteoviolacea]